MGVDVGWPHKPGANWTCCTNLRWKGRPNSRKGGRGPKTPPFLRCIPSGGVGGAMPTEAGGGEVWRSLTGPRANFMIRKIICGLMVLENIVQVALLNKDSAQILAAYRPQKKGGHFIFHPPALLNTGSAPTTFRSILPHPAFYSSQWGNDNRCFLVFFFCSKMKSPGFVVIVDAHFSFG